MKNNILVRFITSDMSTMIVGFIVAIVLSMLGIKGTMFWLILLSVGVIFIYSKFKIINITMTKL